MKTEPMVTDWLTGIGTLALATVGLIVLFFGDRVRAWAMRPKLDANIELAPPACQKTLVDGNIDYYYFRFAVTNTGYDRAQEVEVLATDLVRILPDGSRQPVNSFLPMRLVWLDGRAFSGISRGLPKLCNLGHIVNPRQRDQNGMEDNPTLGIPYSRTLFSFDVEAKTFIKGHLIAPGNYCLSLVIGAANARPTTKAVELTIPGEWYDDEGQMLREGVGISIR